MMVLLLSSLIVVVGGISHVDAQETSSSEISAASGSNRFVVWEDSLGNSDIFFSRSTDNGVTWQPAVNLSNNPGRSLYPQIVVSGSSVHVVWHQDSSDYTSGDVFIRSSTNNGATWGAKINLSATGDVTTLEDHEIAVSGSNVFVVWWELSDSGKGDVFLRRSTDNGATWKAIVNVSNNFSQSSDPDIAAFGSNVYVVWDNWGGTGEHEIFFRRSTDGGATWKANVNISQNPTRSSEPEIAASGSNVYVAWPDGRCFDKTENCDILFRGSANGGATWMSVKNLSNTAEISILPQFAASGSNVYLVWVDKLVVISSPDGLGEGEIFFRRSTDGGATWKPIVNQSNNPGDSRTPHISVSGPNVYIAWSQVNAEESAYDLFFRRSTDNGAAWKSKVNLSNTGRGFDLDLASSGSDVYAALNDATTGNSGIFFRVSTDNGATWGSAKKVNNGGHSPQIGV